MIPAPRTLQLIGDENGCSLWRTFGPTAELQKRGYIAEWDHLDKSPDVFPLVAVGMFEAVIMPRLSWKSEHHAFSRNWIKSLHNAGLAVLYEVDDDVFTPQIAARQLLTTQKDTSLEELEQERRDRITAIRLCDGVTVSSSELRRVVQRYVDAPVRVVPNSIDLRWFRRVLHGVRRRVPPLTIGWAGGARIVEDLEPVAEAWGRIAKRYPHVQFVVQGFVADVLLDAVPRDRMHHLPWLPLEEYPRALTNIDIGCASVANTQFNRCKTPIKVWEYAAAGAAVVASDTLYGPVLRDGVDGLLAETADEWEAALARLVESEGLRRQLRRNQRRVMAERYSLERNWHLWLEAWQELIDLYRAKPRLLLAS